MVEFVGDFDFLRGREGAKRVAMMLIWKGFLYLIDFKCDCGARVCVLVEALVEVVGWSFFPKNERFCRIIHSLDFS
ncbi:TPA: hypothetical protein ACN723_005150 [Klebsiella pneumoniae]|nr:hypothetical protein [Klebsiella pneumoniae]HCM6699646.1 hypothetical protein [Klebsiella pneumoniae]